MPAASTARIARALVAATALAVTVAGCTVAVDGAPHAGPRPSAGSTATPSRPASSDSGSDVYAEWLADGWTPTPVLPVTEPDSGVTAWMFGAAERRPAEGGVAYQANGAPASVTNWFGVFPIPAGYAADAEQAAANTARSKNGRLVSAVPVTVAGHRGLDARIEIFDEQDRLIVDLIRYVELPQHLVGVESIALAGDERVLQQVHAIVVGELALPPA